MPVAKFPSKGKTIYLPWGLPEKPKAIDIHPYDDDYLWFHTLTECLMYVIGENDAEDLGYTGVYSYVTGEEKCYLIWDCDEV